MYIDIVKKSSDPEYIGEWKGLTKNASIFLNLYIKKKYKKHIFFIDLVKLYTIYAPGQLQERGVFLVKLQEDNKMDIEEINKKTVKKELSPYINAYKKSKTQFHFFEINMAYVHPKTEEIYAHSVSALYDRTTNKVEFFNYLTSGTFDLEQFNKQFVIFFQAIYGKSVLINYDKMCYRFGKLANCKLHNIANFKIDGPCMIWTLWFLEFRVKNKHLSREEIIEASLKLFSKDKNLICKVIMDYGIFVDKLVSKHTLKREQNKVKITKKKTVNDK